MGLGSIGSEIGTIATFVWILSKWRFALKPNELLEVQLKYLRFISGIKRSMPTAASQKVMRPKNV